jgi:transcriptional regulator with XRE-family HTH domain
VLSDVAAERVLQLRKRRGMTRDQLAERCRHLGLTGMSAAALANIETGRRDAEGRRRREVTVDELIVFGRALEVPPVLLVAPFDVLDDIEILPGYTMTAHNAWRWLTGEMTWFDGDQFGGRADVVDAYDRHARAMAGAIVAQIEGDQRRVQEHLKELTWVRHEMRGRGWRVPPLAEDVEQRIEEMEQQRRRELGVDHEGMQRK